MEDNSLLNVFLKDLTNKKDLEIKRKILDQKLFTTFYQISRLNNMSLIKSLYQNYGIDNVKKDLDNILLRIKEEDTIVRSDSYLMTFGKKIYEVKPHNTISSEKTRLKTLMNFENNIIDKCNIEKNIAKKMYEMYTFHGRKESNPVIGNVIDFEIPLKQKESSFGGEIDLISYKDDKLYLIELKRMKYGNSCERLFRAILEILTYTEIFKKFERNFLNELHKIHSINVSSSNIIKAIIGPKKMFAEDEMSCELANKFNIKLIVLENEGTIDDYVKIENNTRKIVFRINEYII